MPSLDRNENTLGNQMAQMAKIMIIHNQSEKAAAYCSQIEE